MATAMAMAVDDAPLRSATEAAAGATEAEAFFEPAIRGLERPEEAAAAEDSAVPSVALPATMTTTIAGRCREQQRDGSALRHRREQCQPELARPRGGRG